MKRMLSILALLVTATCPLMAQSIRGSSQSSSQGANAQATSGRSSSTTALQQKQAELSQLERQLEQIRKQIDMQKKKEVTAFGGGYGTSTTPTHSRTVTRHIVLPGTSPSSANLLVVPGESVDPEQVSSILEDMRVMSRILEKELKDFNLSTRQDFFNRWGTSEHRIEGLYLDGYGLVFQLEVEFPLLADEDEEKQEEDKDVGDKVWSETRQELFEPNRKRYQEKNEQRPYDAKKVVNLKDSIARTLRHASNIRALKDNECVAIVVTSGSEASNNAMMLYGGDGMGYGAAMSTGYGAGAMMGPDSSIRQGRSVLTVKAAKAHIDSFAQNQLDLDQFRSALQITLY